MTEVRGASSIEQYLDELVTALSTRRPRQLRHLLAETEAHLRDDADAAMAEGLSVEEAEALAVSRFGPARELAAADDARMATPLRVVVRQVAMTALLLSGIAGVAIGVSGAIAALIRAAGGTRALVAVAPGQALSAGDCARWLAADPGAGSCRNAAAADWAAETVLYRLAAGVLGLLCVLAYMRLRRRAFGSDRWPVLPATVTNTIALTAFGAAGVWTLGLGVDAIAVSSGHGSGQWLSAAPVALLAAAVFGLRLLGNLRSGTT
ncbi:MAG: hypothetical protein QOK30_2260 [Nocardioidaceae bacterium]|nr:hypothetical protein [Nocardioidaceae bacterium]